jgi:hypothetical protein
MRTVRLGLIRTAALLVPLTFAPLASAQEQPAPAPEPAAQAAPSQDTTQQDATQQTAAAEAPLPPPPEAPQIATEAVAQGQWVATETYGWVWVPAGATTYAVGAEPYAYLYTPVYGWTWYVSPWGRGRFQLGPWVHVRMAAPHVWLHDGWIAPRGIPVRVAPRAYAPPAYVAPRAYAPRAVLHVAPQGGGRGHR